MAAPAPHDLARGAEPDVRRFLMRYLDQGSHEAPMSAAHYYYGRVADTADLVITAIDARQPLQGRLSDVRRAARLSHLRFATPYEGVGHETIPACVQKSPVAVVQALE